jgi:tRNA-dihydrouridine synthase B
MLPWLANDSFPLYLAPMAGFTDVVYRQLCKREGADVMVSEFVMSDAILRGYDEVWETIDFTEDQRPMGIQIFGAEPDSMARAALIVRDKFAPDFIDLNFGCPSEKVTCLQAGASLLKEPRKLAAIATEVVSALSGFPVTAKTRIGWDADSIVAREVGLRLQDAGVQALTIHGRTKQQGYTGAANWDIIADVAETLTIPVIGNGDVKSAEQVCQIRNQTAIRGAMIGRAAIGYPWIFGEIKTALETGMAPLPPSLEKRWDTLLWYAHQLASRPQRMNEEKSIRWMRTRLVKLTKDMLGCKNLRIELGKISHLEELQPIAERHLSRYAHVDAIIRERRLRERDQVSITR